MVFKKLRERLSERRDPFATRGFEDLTLEEQERALTQVGTKEAELIERQEAVERGESSRRVREASAIGISKLGKKSVSERVRDSIAGKEKARRDKKATEVARARQLSFQQRIRQASQAPLPTGRGLSPFQQKIIRRELIMKRIRETPPMDRPKMLSRSDPFKARIRQIRGLPEPISSGLIQNSPSKLAEEDLKRRILEANQGRSNTVSSLTTLRNAREPPRFKAPERLL